MHVNFVMEASQQNCIQLGNPVRSWVALYYGCAPPPPPPMIFDMSKLLSHREYAYRIITIFFAKVTLELFQLLRILTADD